jgi:hypothetical protein
MRLLFMLKFSVKGGIFLQKILNNRFFSFSVIAILFFILLLVHYPWWVALFNSLAIVLVEVLINIAVKKLIVIVKDIFIFQVGSHLFLFNKMAI